VAVLFGVGALFVGGLGAVGPVLYGFSYDATGSYNLAFLVTGVLCIASALCLFLLKRPRKKREVS